MAASGSPAISATSDFGTAIPGQHVYMAGVLTPAETQALERRAADLTASGTPVVVYLRAQDATQSQTTDDARDLMDAWNVQSAPDARDGLVIFLNLRPDDAHHGQAALFAGRRYVDDGTLSDSVLKRIFTRDMQPALVDGRLADGIAAGLDAVGQAIAAGPPPPSPLQQTAANLSRVPLNIASALLGILLTLWAFAIWRGRPRASFPELPSTVLPEQLAPALAVALATGHLRDEQLEATILDLAARGALARPRKLSGRDSRRRPTKMASYSQSGSRRCDAAGPPPGRRLPRTSKLAAGSTPGRLPIALRFSSAAQSPSCSRRLE